MPGRILVARELCPLKRSTAGIASSEFLPPTKARLLRVENMRDFVFLRCRLSGTVPRCCREGDEILNGCPREAGSKQESRYREGISSRLAGLHCASSSVIKHLNIETSRDPTQIPSSNMYLRNLATSLLLSGAYWLGAASIALPEDGTFIEGKPQAHNIHVIDLDAYEARGNGTMDPSVNAGLEARTPDTCCGVKLTSGRVGCGIGAFGALATAAIFISSQIKQNSNNNDCELHVGQADGISWTIRATGRNCDTTAQQGTIQGAIDEYIDALGDKMCGVSCMVLSHGGGTWRGYVTISLDGSNPSNYYCGASQNWGNCYVGGVNVSCPLGLHI